MHIWWWLLAENVAVMEVAVVEVTDMIVMWSIDGRGSSGGAEGGEGGVGKRKGRRFINIYGYNSLTTPIC